MLPPIVRLVTIPPLHAVLSHGHGKHPEVAAHESLFEWAASRGLLRDPAACLRVGRNNPPPTPGREEYGYDSMLAAAGELPEAEGFSRTEVPGGTYAVVRCTLANITERWHFLYGWVRESGREVASHGLEEQLTEVDESRPEQMLFDLWLPVRGEPR